MQRIKEEKREFKNTFAVTALILVIFLFTAIFVKYVSSEFCIRILRDGTEQFASQIRSSMENSRKSLRMSAHAFEAYGEISDSSMSVFMESTEDGTLPDMGILLADGRAILSSDEYAPWIESLNFAEEMKRAPYTSGLNVLEGKGTRFVCQSEPVMIGGKAAGLIYSIIPLDSLIEENTADIYNGAAYQYIVDGASGTFLIDTWYNRSGNIYDDWLEEYKMRRGYSVDKMRADMENGESGYIAFHSRSTGDNSFLYYTPIGVEKWSAALSVSEGIAMYNANLINRMLYVVMLLIFAILAAYLFLSWRNLRKHMTIRDIELQELQNSHDTIAAMAITDVLTGLNNRSGYQQAISEYQSRGYDSIGCIYIDVNDLHYINNHYGHRAGDEMLRYIASQLRRKFDGDDLFRIGGDEFVVFSLNAAQDEIMQKITELRRVLEKSSYEIALGFKYHSGKCENIEDIIAEAEQRMFADKQEYYERMDNIAKSRNLDRKMESILVEKRDRDNFLAVISSYFMGVYIVDLATDRERGIYTPHYFEKMLKKAGDKFSDAIKDYVKEFVSPADGEELLKCLDYEWLREKLSKGEPVTGSYKKKDNTEVVFCVYKFMDFGGERAETIWLFEEIQ